MFRADGTARRCSSSGTSFEGLSRLGYYTLIKAAPDTPDFARTRPQYIPFRYSQGIARDQGSRYPVLGVACDWRRSCRWGPVGSAMRIKRGQPVSKLLVFTDEADAKGAGAVTHSCGACLGLQPIWAIHPSAGVIEQLVCVMPGTEAKAKDSSRLAGAGLKKPFCSV
jgi:hypothetical protein